MKLFGGKRSAGRLARGSSHGNSKYKIMIAVIAVSLILVVSGAVYIVSLIRAPEIPVISNDDGVAFHAPEYNHEDAQIGDGMIAPEGVTNDDRTKNFFTFLIVGVDDGVNTDTIMVASYDGEKKEANVINIPRDTLVNVKRSVKKINAAYAVGANNGGGVEGGIQQLQREVKTIIGFVPDFYIAVDMEAFIKLVDMVGGVEVDVPFNMIYDDPTQDLHTNIKQGEDKLLNGEDTLKFARFRKGNAKVSKTISDYDRIKNQQTVINSLVKRLIRAENLARINELTKIFTDNVHTSLEAGNIMWLGFELQSIKDTDNLHFYTIPTKGTSGAPGWYEYLDRDAVLELVNRTINPFDVEIEADDVDIIDSVP